MTLAFFEHPLGGPLHPIWDGVLRDCVIDAKYNDAWFTVDGWDGMLKQIGPNVVIKGHLGANGKHRVAIGDNVTVTRSAFFFTNAPLAIGRNFRVGHYLGIDTKEMPPIGDGLKVAGILDIMYAQFEAVPRHVSCGDLRAALSSLTELPLTWHCDARKPWFSTGKERAYLKKQLLHYDA